MTLITAHPIRATFHAIMFNRRYQTRERVPVIRRVFGIVTRTVYVDVLRNNANIVRPHWDAYVSVSVFTIAIVRK